MSNFTVVNPQPKVDNPHVIEDYPYGFRLRTQIRYWVETKDKNGQRLVSQTLNPKTNKWNKPKKSTYSDVLAVYTNDENGHLMSSGISFAYDGQGQLDKFVDTFKDVLSEWHRKQFKYFQAVIDTRKHVKCTIAPTSHNEEERKAREVEQEQVKKDINKTFHYYLDKQGS